MEYDVEYQQIVNVNIDEERFTLNLKGTLFNLNGVNGSAVIIPNMQMSFNIGQTTNELDISGYTDDDRAYIPLIIAENSIAEHIQTMCVYNTLAKKVVYYTDNTQKTSSGNTIILFPTGSDIETVTGITNGQYYATYGRSYSKSEEDALLADKQDLIDSTHKLSADLVDDTSTTNKFVTASDKTTWNAKQDTLTAGTGISITDNVISATGEDVIVFDEFSFMETPSSPDVSEVLFNKITLSDNRVVDGRQYFPMFISNGNNMPYLSNSISYRKSDKRIAIITNHIVGNTRSFTGTLVLIPCNSDTTGNIQVGYCNGLYDDTSSKTIVTDNQIANMQTTTNLVTSVDSSSTDSQYPSAKLFYDTCGDIETLINAL